MELTKFERMLMHNHIIAYAIGTAIRDGIEVTEKNLMNIIDENEEVVESALAFKVFASLDEEMTLDAFCEYSFITCMEEFGEEIMEQIVDVMEQFQ
jgi:hypothetical protein